MLNGCSKIVKKEAIDTKHSNIPGNYRFPNSVFLSFSWRSYSIFGFKVEPQHYLILDCYPNRRAQKPVCRRSELYLDNLYITYALVVGHCKGLIVQFVGNSMMLLLKLSSI